MLYLFVARVRMHTGETIDADVRSSQAFSRAGPGLFYAPDVILDLEDVLKVFMCPYAGVRAGDEGALV